MPDGQQRWEPRTEYARKLQDPRWQKRRLEIMVRDDYQCQVCGDCRSMLNVHHVMYCPWERIDPWDESPDLLVTLCVACHQEEPAHHPSAVYDLLQCLGAAGIRTAWDLNRVAEFAMGEIDFAAKEHGRTGAQDAAEVVAKHIARFNRERRLSMQWPTGWYHE